jgi:hypothetical protein
MSDFSVSFRPRTVVVEASYTLLVRVLVRLLVLGLALLSLTSDAPTPCDQMTDKASRMCKAMAT